MSTHSFQPEAPAEHRGRRDGSPWRLCVERGRHTKPCVPPAPFSSHFNRKLLHLLRFLLVPISVAMDTSSPWSDVTICSLRSDRCWEYLCFFFHSDENLLLKYPSTLYFSFNSLNTLTELQIINVFNQNEMLFYSQFQKSADDKSH